MKKIFSILFFTLFAQSANAETVYVTDLLKVNLRATEGKSGAVVGVVSSGLPLTVLENTPSGYKKVRLENGTEGYIMGRFTVKKPPGRWHLEQTKKELEKLQEENTQLKTQLDKLLGVSDTSALNAEEIAEQREKLSREFRELRQTSAHAVEIKFQRDQLQERVVTNERDLEQLKREKQTLEDSTNQDWFLYGGILAFTGIFLGIFIPRLSLQRRSSWDSY